MEGACFSALSRDFRLKHDPVFPIERGGRLRLKPAAGPIQAATGVPATISLTPSVVTGRPPIVS